MNTGQDTAYNLRQFLAKMNLIANTYAEGKPELNIKYGYGTLSALEKQAADEVHNDYVIWLLPQTSTGRRVSGGRLINLMSFQLFIGKPLTIDSGDSYELSSTVNLDDVRNIHETSYDVIAAMVKEIADNLSQPSFNYAINYHYFDYTVSMVGMSINFTYEIVSDQC